MSFVPDGQPSFQPIGSIGWGMQFVRNPFHLLESSMKFQVQSSLGSLKLVSSLANPLMGPLLFILIFFCYVVRLPLHPSLRYILICLNCALAQLSPSAWCAMISMYILCKLRGFLDPTFSQFQRNYQLMSLSGDKKTPPSRVGIMSVLGLNLPL